MIDLDYFMSDSARKAAFDFIESQEIDAHKLLLAPPGNLFKYSRLGYYTLRNLRKGYLNAAMPFLFVKGSLKM